MHIWQQVIIKNHGTEKAQQLAAAIRQQCATLIAETSMPEDHTLRWHLKANILPGLALYRVLLKQYNGDQQAALAEVDNAFRAQTLAKYRLLLAPLKVMPTPFRLFKLAFSQMMKKFPAAGWNFSFVENSDDQIAFNATSCFYLNTLTALGAPELTASFCKSDDVLAELFPPSILFIREHTLGRGDIGCDFKYRRVKKPENPLPSC